MSSKPKNFSQAIDDLEQETESNGSGFKSRLQSELHNLEETLAKIRPHLDEVTARVGDEAKKAKHKVEEQVQKNPLAAIGIVGLIFFILGFLFSQVGSRKRDLIISCSRFCGACSATTPKCKCSRR